MRLLYSASALFFVLVASAYGSKVIELTDANFDSETSKGGAWFVKFYAPWCGHCKNLAPTWEELAANVASHPDKHVAHIDCTENKETCNKFDVKGYPTLKLIKNDEVSDYKGSRDKDDLSRFLYAASKASTNVVELTDANFDSETSKGGSWFVKFYAPWCGHCKNLAPTWEELAASLVSDPDNHVAHIDCTENKEICERFDVKGYPNLKLLKDGDVIDYKGPREIPDFVEFMKSDHVEEETKVVQLTEDNFDSLTATGTWFIKFYAPWCSACKQIAPAWRELGAAAESDLDYHVGEVDCTLHNGICKDKMEVKAYPTLAVFENGALKGTYNGPQDVHNMWEYLKSDHVELVSKAVELTDENFAELVGKGIWFVQFYAPWCVHCKNMAQAWSDLAEAVEKDPKYNVGRIDCTSTRDICVQYDIEGFPTMKLFKDGEFVKDYIGDRSEGDLMRTFKGKIEKEVEVATDVVELTDANFESKTSKGAWFVKFFAPWCGHCKNLAPTWEELAADLASDSDHHVAHIDCTENKETCNKFGVKGYPTLKLINNGKVSEYEGARTKELMMAFFLIGTGSEPSSGGEL